MMYPMHLYIGKHILYSGEVSIEWRYFGCVGSSGSIATPGPGVLVEQAGFHMHVLRKTSKKVFLATKAGMTETKSPNRQLH